MEPPVITHGLHGFLENPQLSSFWCISPEGSTKTCFETHLMPRTLKKVQGYAENPELRRSNMGESQQPQGGDETWSRGKNNRNGQKSSEIVMRPTRIEGCCCCLVLSQMFFPRPAARVDSSLKTFIFFQVVVPENGRYKWMFP